MNSNLNEPGEPDARGRTEAAPENAVFGRNLRLLRERFPDLAALLALDTDEKARATRGLVPETYRTEPSRNGAPILTVGGFPLHSKYDPEREAARAVERAGNGGCVFAGLGMGYYCLEYAARFPDAFIAVVEPDVFVFLRCIENRDMGALLGRKNTALFIGLSAFDSAAAVEEIMQKSATPPEILAPPALAKPNQAWFAEFSETLKRNKEKRGINKNTLKRFGGLWLKNMSKNLGEMGGRPGVSHFKDVFTDVPAALLAAGPSLDTILPHLKTLREKCVLIAVDTSLRACLNAGVQPDFVVLVDPQYWNYRHIAGLSSGRTFLVTESAAYPAVFRFPCRGVFLCASLFPLGKFLESRTEEKGSLGAGGSVATTAWDFARYTGAKTIYAAGLDLGYPGGATHFRGALFEEKNLSEADRLSPAETGATAALASGGLFYTDGYGGGKVLTDRRLNLYAWWFEAAAARHPDTTTYIIGGGGVKIPGMEPVAPERLHSLPDRRADVDAALEKAEKAAGDAAARSGAGDAFARALDELEAGLNDILSLAKKGEACCARLRYEIARSRTGSGGAERDARAIFNELNAIDARIQRHPVKDILAMTFEDEPERGAAADAPPLDETISESAALYKKVEAAALKNLKALRGE